MSEEITRSEFRRSHNLLLLARVMFHVEHKFGGVNVPRGTLRENMNRGSFPVFHVEHFVRRAFLNPVGRVDVETL